MPFDGETYRRDLDMGRLKTQLDRVYTCLRRDPRWWTLSELQAVCGGSEAGVSARVRDLRKDKFGGNEVERQRGDGGLWRYRMVVGEPRQRELFA